MGTAVGYPSGGYGAGPRLGLLTRWLLIINGAVFLLLFLLMHVISPAAGQTLLGLLAFSLDGLRHGMVWQFITYAFTETGVTSVLFNGLALYSFGTSMESGLGPRRFLGLYLTGILGGSLGALLLQAILTWGRWGEGMIIGAHAPILAMIVVFSILYPTASVLFFGFIPMKSKHMAWLLVGMAMLDAVEHAVGWHLFPLAHLGGALAGYLWWRVLRWNRIRRFTNPFHQIKIKKHKLSIIRNDNDDNNTNEKEIYH